MTRPRISQVLLWILALVTLALFGFFVALVAGAIPVGDPPPPADSGLLEAPQTKSADEPAAKAVTRSVLRPHLHGAADEHDIAIARDSRRHGSARGLLDFSSSRLRDGRVLDERILAQGESVTLRGKRVWISIGAAANVDVTVNGEDRELQSGTVAVVLGPA